MARLDGIIWLFTASCQLRCKHCYTTIYRSELELSLSDKLRLVREAAELGVSWINITGGEPLLSPHFWRVVEEALDYGIEVTVNTNGLLVDDSTAKRLSKLVDTVYVSVDGGRRGHEALRGSGTYDRAIEAVRKLIEAGANVITVMALSSLNYREAGDYLKTVTGLGVEFPALIPVMNQGRARETGVAINAKQLMEALNLVDSVSEELGISVWLWCMPFTPITGVRRGYATYCRLLNIVDVSPGGYLLLCDVTGIRVSSVRSGLARALEEYESNSLVRRVVKPSLRGACVGCPIANECRGGCFARSLLEYGDPNAGDPLCPRVAKLAST